MFWIVLLLILLGGSFYFYQRMVALEQEIRAEQEREKELQAQQVNQESAAAAPKKIEPALVGAAAENPATEMAENPILQCVCAHPGVVQADLYADVPQLNKKQAQQMIRELVDAGKIRRERLGSSFKLYLA
ncbi:hypothetical protein [Pelovirga terrestris]|uniref:Uncharacterized protein n=1 Tax=Pelovirga terrestris TaxID=2771352 RepID=A0A8J6UPV6_9BACT|nr:hypothetical protein [Pelovirga terrestris]MBD1400934.1 hypothetical protein [Pelovirga terrestris]